MRFCPICGKKGIKGDFCEECRPQESDLGFKEINVKICVECEAFMLGNSWKSSKNIVESIVRVAKSKIKNPKKKFLEIKPQMEEYLVPKPGVKKLVELLIIEENKNEYLIPATVDFTYCPRCGKKGSQYFEGILQLRNPSKKLIEYVNQEFKKAEKRKIFVNNVEKTKNGVDYYVTDKKYMRRLGSDINKKFKGEFNESAQLFSRDSLRSKHIYRLNILFREYGANEKETPDNSDEDIIKKTVDENYEQSHNKENHKRRVSHGRV